MSNSENSRLGLNIDMDDVARRLSFSPASSPQMPPRKPSRFRVVPDLSPIAEDPREQQAAATPARPPPWVSSPFSAAPHTATCESPATSLPPVSPSPVRTQVVPASPAPPSQTQQQQVAAALGKLEQTRQAGLQQAWAAAQQQNALASAFRGWDQRRQAAPQPQQAVGLLPGSQQAFPQPYPEPPQQQLRLYTVEGEPAGYKTKWEELHPVSQQLLLQIEDKIREERQASEQLDQCSRLCDLSVSNNSFERDARQITQEQFFLPVTGDWDNLHHHGQGEGFRSQLNGCCQRNYVHCRICYRLICEVETMVRQQSWFCKPCWIFSRSY